MNYRLINLNDKSDIKNYVVSSEDNLSKICSILKIGNPNTNASLIELFKIVSANTDLSEDLYSVFSTMLQSKYGVSQVVEISSESGKALEILPFYGTSITPHEKWVSTIDSLLSTLPFATSFDTESKVFLSDYESQYYREYRSLKYPDLGFVFITSDLSNSTSLRVVFTDDVGVTYYLKTLNKTSGRYNRITGSDHLESLSVMIACLSSLDLDDLYNSSYDLVFNLDRSKKISFEELYSLYNNYVESEPSSDVENLLKEYLQEASEEQTRDYLWRSTNLKKTIGDLYDIFANIGGCVKNPRVCEYLGSLISSPMISDRLCEN